MLNPGHIPKKKNKKLQVIRIPKVTSPKEVLEVIPFETYKHTLPQPFRCEYYDKKDICVSIVGKLNDAK